MEREERPPQHQYETNGPEGPSSTRGRGEPHDALRRLEQRLNRASDAAERLIAEAAAQATARSARPPAAGWQQPEPEARGPSTDLAPLLQVLESLRELVPPELQRRLAEALRELLVAVRALIDMYLERVERHRTEPAEVQDIPIR